MIKRQLFTVICLSLLTTESAFGQIIMKMPKEDAGFLQYAIGVGMTFIVVVSAFVHSKRSHQN